MFPWPHFCNPVLIETPPLAKELEFQFYCKLFFFKAVRVTQLIKQSELTFVWATESLSRLQTGVDASEVAKERTHLLLPALLVLLCPTNRKQRERQQSLIWGREHTNTCIMGTIYFNSLSCSSFANWKGTTDHLLPLASLVYKVWFNPLSVC